MFSKKGLQLILENYSKDNIGRDSASLAYAAIFTIGPMLLILISVAGIFLGTKAAEGKIFSELTGVVGPNAARAIQNVVLHTQKSRHNGLAIVVGIIGTLLGATGLTGQLQGAFDSIFRVVPDPKGGVKRTVYLKAKNILVILISGLLIGASLIATIVMQWFSSRVGSALHIPLSSLQYVNGLISLLVFIILTYFIYKTLPDVVIPWKIVLVTSVFISILFLIGKIVLGLVIGHNGTASAYGAAASFVTLLLWVYYSAQIVLLGAEGMKAYAFFNDLSYDAKRLTLKRNTISIDTENFTGRIIDAWFRGFRRRMR